MKKQWFLSGGRLKPTNQHKIQVGDPSISPLHLLLKAT